MPDPKPHDTLDLDPSGARLIVGDCLQTLRTLPDNSVDSLVTDPPAGIGFMGKEWDDFRRTRNPNDVGRENVFGRVSKRGPEYGRSSRENFIQWLAEVMKECLRVLKPGGHGLVWAIPRTSHWTAMALEDAGFEIRDCVYHLFGSGFPKSLNISKAIDKAAGAKRKVLGRRMHPTLRDPGKLAEGAGAAHGGNEWSREWDVTAPETEPAKQWEGWGTALKPAAECWLLVRKPLSEKTVSANVIRWGTGAINIDASRVPSGQDHKEKCESVVGLDSNRNGNAYGDWNGERVSSWSPEGRFPANLVLSHTLDCTENGCHHECAILALDRQSGITKSGVSKKLHQAYDGQSSTGFLRGESSPANQHGGMGGASRFFYCAKASRKNRGLKNTHPTVKSTDLMAYLIRLITPPNGVVLDPFMGPGSTGVSALQNSFRFIGIEASSDYAKIAESRIRQASLRKS